MKVAFVNELVDSAIPPRGTSAGVYTDGIADTAAPMCQEALVSVIIPCYNSEVFLEEAIGSAMAQTYSPVEIIVVDDGSTDHSPEIAKRFPVRYIRQPNSGLAASRNLGIRESKGSYIVFLDADDRLKPEAIETGVRILAQRPQYAMAVGDHLFVSRNGSYLAPSRKNCPPAFHYEALLRSNFIEMVSTVLFRRNVLEEARGFDTRFRVSEDYELYLRVARAHSIYCHPAIVAEYRIHESNISRNAELMLITTLRVLRSQAPFVRGDLRRLSAFLDGLRTWRKKYGRRLTLELAHSSSALQPKQRRRKLLLLADHYPQGLIMLLLYRIMPGLGKRAAGIRGQHGNEGSPSSPRAAAYSSASRAQSSTRTWLLGTMEKKQRPAEHSVQKHA
jgi:glycosyltransferase involved in cell wall biosynthesis